MFFKIISICLTFNALRNKNTFHCVYERKCKSSFYVKKKKSQIACTFLANFFHKNKNKEK